MKFYDVRSFDMIAVLNLSFSPGTTAFVSRKNALMSRVAVADTDSSMIHIVSPSSTPAILKTLKIHVAPVTAMAYDASTNIVISGDSRGMLEYWNADTFKRPNRKTSKLVSFKHKGATDGNAAGGGEKSEPGGTEAEVEKEAPPPVTPALKPLPTVEEEKAANRRADEIRAATGDAMKAYADLAKQQTLAAAARRQAAAAAKTSAAPATST